MEKPTQMVPVLALLRMTVDLEISCDIHGSHDFEGRFECKAKKEGHWSQENLLYFLVARYSNTVKKLPTMNESSQDYWMAKGYLVGLRTVLKRMLDKSQFDILIQHFAGQD